MQEYDTIIIKKVAPKQLLLPKSASATQIAFYKDRILYTANDLISGQNKINDLPDTIRDSWSAFMNSCINHFKLIDINDHIQGQVADCKNEMRRSDDIDIAALNKNFLFSPQKQTFKKAKKAEYKPLIKIPMCIDFDFIDPKLKTKGIN